MRNKREILKKGLVIACFCILLSLVFFLAIQTSYTHTKSNILSDAKSEIGQFDNTIKNNDMENLNELSENDEINETEVKTIEGIKNILLLGTDFRSGDDTARTDSMMLVTLDTINNKIKVTSLLRDMLVNIQGYGKSKLNHAFAFGGAELTMKTIEDNFGIKVDDYVMVDFNGFIAVIDKLGGVEVDVQEQDLTDFNAYVYDVNPEDAIEINEPGRYKLNGTQALAYCRIRKNSGGEQRRTERQREVINAIMKEVKNTNIIKYPSLIKTGLDYIDTNLKFTDILALANTISKLELNNIETLQVPFEDISIGGTWKNYGWVFRIDLDITAKLLQDYIYEDISVDTSNINKNQLNYNE